MKAIARNSHMLTKEERKAMNKEIKAQAIKQFDEMALAADTIMIMALRDTFGFGEKRINDFMSAMSELRKTYRERYTGGDEDDYIYGMIRDLKWQNIDVEKLHKQCEMQFEGDL